jgi:hypothetical protein
MKDNVTAKARPRLRFSVLITVTGNLVDHDYYPCDSTLPDFMQAIAPYLGDADPTEPGDSEYHYLATENGADGFRRACIDAVEGGNERIARWLADRYPYDPDIWWALCSDYQNMGILDSRAFFDFLRNVGMIFEDRETLGTLGGPLGGIAPDVSFTSESQAAIVSMRATPFLERPDGTVAPVSPASWKRLKPLYDDPWKVERREPGAVAAS